MPDDFGDFIPMSEDELNREIGGVSQQLEHRVNDKLEEIWETFIRRYPDLKKPTILYDLQGHTGGWAIGGHTIRLNTSILNDPRYTDHMIHQTLPHEIAHIVVHQLYPGAKGHGREWRNMMHLLGLKADRCHQYETQAVRKHARYTYYCECDTPHQVTKTLHNRIQAGRIYTCRRCKQILRERR